MTSVENIRKNVLELITKHDADKIEAVDVLMKKWKGKENDLLRTLCEKYKEKYTKMKPSQIKRVYSIGSKVGYGKFNIYIDCSRRKCKRRSDGVIFEMKIINKRGIYDLSTLENLESEINILRQISHRNIIKLHDIFDSRSKMCLILDLIEGEPIFDRIIEKQHFSEKDAAMIFIQICEALKYLHSKCIVHNHLKPQNLLFATKHINESQIKLIDFGLAASFKNGDLYTSELTYDGNGDYDYYIAPEILRRSRYDRKVDMWSIGVILYVTLCGFLPFYDESIKINYDEYLIFGFIRKSQKLLSHQTNSFYIIPQSIILLCLQFCGNHCNQYWFKKRRLYKKITCGQYDMPSPFWDTISKNAKDLVRKLLQTDPTKRLTASDALQHPWCKANESVQSLGHDHILNLKRFQYIQRLRSGIRCILAVLRIIEALQS